MRAGVLATKRLIWWALVWLLLLPTQVAGACSPAPPPNFLCEVEPSFLQQPKTCLNGDCTLYVEGGEDSERFAVISNGEWAGSLHSMGIEPGYRLESWGIDLADQVCTFDFSAAPEIRALAESWSAQQHSSFILEPVSARRSVELDLQHRDLLSCHDAVYVNERGMLASYEQVRPYCRSYPVLICGGSTTAISASAFFHYLLSNPNDLTMPYLSTLIFLMVGTAYFFGFLYRKGELGLFFLPTRVHMWGLVIGIPVFWLCATTTAIYLGNIMGIYYVFLTITNYAFGIHREYAEAD